MFAGVASDPIRSAIEDGNFMWNREILAIMTNS